MRSILMAAMVLIAIPAFGDYEEIKVVVNTQSTRKEQDVKRLEKAGMLHTGNQLNKRIKNAKVFIDRANGKIKLEYDYPSLEWALASYAYPFWFNLADKNGNILERFKTSEDFVPEGVYFRTDPKTNGRSLLDGHRGKYKKALLIKPTGNIQTYDVNLRDAPHVRIVEFGFITTLSGRQNPMDEFVPAKIFIKDWSKDKEYK